MFPLVRPNSVLRKFLLLGVLFGLAILLAALPVSRGALAAEPAEPAPPEAGIVLIPTLNIPVMKRMRVRGQLIVQVMLDVEKAELMAEVAHQMPRLRAEYSEVLSKWSERYQDIRAPANVIAIRRQLQGATNRVLHSEHARILLQQAMLRRRG